MANSAGDSQNIKMKCLSLYLRHWRAVMLLFSAAFTWVSAAAIPHLSQYSASGYRNNSNGSLNNVGSNGYVWLSSANSQNNAYNLNFNLSNVNPQNNNNRANGYSVRPVQASAMAEGFVLKEMKLNKNTLDKLLTLAYLDARENERTKLTQLSFECNLEHNLRRLREELWKREYRPSPPVCFVIETPREVFAPLFRDRIVSHLLFNMIAPLFEPLFIYDSYSCREEKGTLFGIRRLERHLRSCTENYTGRAYVLCLDISGYFMSINKGILYSILCREMQRNKNTWKQKIDYDFTDYLIRSILFRNPTEGAKKVGDLKGWERLSPHKSLFNSPIGTGLTIGDVTSQLFSNIYLNPLDHYIKRELKCKHYGRYVDDIRIVGKDKRELVRTAVAVDAFLRHQLGLRLNEEKTRIVRAGKTVDFLGANIRGGRRYTKRNTLCKFRNKSFFGQSESVLNSYLGYLKHFRADKSIKRIIFPLLESGIYIANKNCSKVTFNIGSL